MLEIDDLNDDVLEAIANYMDLDSSNEEDLRQIAELSPEDAFDKFLGWYGIIGYSGTIRRAWENLKLVSKPR